MLERHRVLLGRRERTGCERQSSCTSGSKSIDSHSSNAWGPPVQRPQWLPSTGIGQKNFAPEYWALELQQLIQFLEACKETEVWDALLSQNGRVSIADVNWMFVIPWTKGTGSSVALLMNGTHPLKADLMISHTWGEDADELIDAVKLFHEKCQVPMTAAAFFCTLSLYQVSDEAPGALSIPEQIALAPFKKVIEERPLYGMMVVHTTAQDVYTRMWCVHEVDEALEAHIAVRGAMSQKFRAKFIGPASEALLDLRTEQAKCSYPGDEAMLREAILKKPGSFERLDRVILALRREMFAAEEAVLLNGSCTLQVDSIRERPVRQLRGVSGRRMLSWCASILRQPTTAETFEASEEVNEIDYFVSHSLRTSWAAKAWAIQYTVSVMPAVVIACLSHIIVLATFASPKSCLAWHAYALRSWFVGRGYEPPRSVSLTTDFTIACIVFAGVMLLAPHIPGLLSSKFYIDKCCVAHDAESQLRAIRQLRITILSSKKMILLWQPTYFDSLANVHELATFVHARGSACNVRIVPVVIPLLTGMLFLFHFFATMALTIVTPLLLGSRWHMTWVAYKIPCNLRFWYLLGWLFVVCFFGLYLPPSFLVWRYAQSYMKQRRRLKQQLSTFSVERSRCFLEAHRQALVSDITTWFGSATEFEKFIQNDVAQQISLLNKAPVPLLSAMVGAISHLFFCSMGIFNAIQEHENDIAIHALICLPLIWICTDSFALNAVLLLAGNRYMRDEGESLSFFRRKLLGPIASATIFAGLNAVGLGVLFPVLPIWAATTILLSMMAAVGIMYRCDYAPAHDVKSVGSISLPVAEDSESGSSRTLSPCSSSSSSSYSSLLLFPPFPRHPYSWSPPLTTVASSGC